MFSEISRNTFKYNNHDGIKLYGSNSNKIFENYVVNNGAGIGLENSNDNIVYMNTFSQNNFDAISIDSTNYFNSLEHITYFYQDTVFQNFLGNYWGNYLGNDLNSDGIGEMKLTEIPKLKISLKNVFLLSKNRSFREIGRNDLCELN